MESRAASRRNDLPVGKELSSVFKHDDAVAQPAPSLLRVRGHDPGSFPVDGVSARAWGLVFTHCGVLRLEDVWKATRNSDILCQLNDHLHRR